MQAVSLQHMDGTVQLTITDASLGQPQYFVFIYRIIGAKAPSFSCGDEAPIIR